MIVERLREILSQKILGTNFLRYKSNLPIYVEFCGSYFSVEALELHNDKLVFLLGETLGDT